MEMICRYSTVRARVARMRRGAMGCVGAIACNFFDRSESRARSAGPLFLLLVVGQKHDTGVIAWHFNNVLAHSHPVSYLSIDIRALSFRVETFG